MSLLQYFKLKWDRDIVLVNAIAVIASNNYSNLLGIYVYRCIMTSIAAVSFNNIET